MRLEYLHLSPNQAPPQVIGEPFCAVIVSEVEVTQEWRKRIAEWLLKNGCLYVVAWGVDCEDWHDTVDWTNLEEFDFGDIPDDKFVMTSWHDGAPLSEALFFAGQCASHPNVELERTLILQIADEVGEAELMGAYANSQIVAED